MFVLFFCAAWEGAGRRVLPRHAVSIAGMVLPNHAFFGRRRAAAYLLLFNSIAVRFSFSVQYLGLHKRHCARADRQLPLSLITIFLSVLCSWISCLGTLGLLFMLCCTLSISRKSPRRAPATALWDSSALLDESLRDRQERWNILLDNLSNSLTSFNQPHAPSCLYERVH